MIKYLTKNKDVDRYILSLLSYRDILRVCQVSKYTQNLCDDSSLWRNKIKKDFPRRSKIYYRPYVRLWHENPKELYRIINQPSKIISIEEEEYPELEFYTIHHGEYKIGIEIAEIITNVFQLNLHNIPLLRGDIIHLTWLGDFRNEGKLIWTGEKIVELDYNIDDYGSVPSEFQFPEFPLDHFQKSLERYSILWLSSATVQEAIDNYDEKKEATRLSDLYYSYYPIFAPLFSLNGENYETFSKEKFVELIKIHPYLREIDIEDAVFYAIEYREVPPNWVIGNKILIL